MTTMATRMTTAAMTTASSRTVNPSCVITRDRLSFHLFITYHITTKSVRGFPLFCYT